MEGRTTRPGEEARIPIEQEIGLRFKHLGEFVAELAANLSTGGMFIRTRQPHPVGSVFEFELRLAGDQPLIAGKAQVAWIRRRGEAPEEPAGMGVRFVELDDDSRRQVAELVAAREAAGGQPVDLAAPQESSRDDAPPAAGGPEAVAASPAVGGTAGAAAAPPSAAAVAAPALLVGRAAAAPARRSRLPWLLLIVVLVAALAAAFWPRPGARTTASPSETPARPAAESAAAEAPDAAVEAAPEPRPADLVEEWARAWSEQRVDDYLATYSPRFEPDGRLSREAWEERRRARLLAPRWIEVGLAFVEIEETGPDRVRVRFVQEYQSDSFHDVVRKYLDLGREADGWKILRESVES